MASNQDGPADAYRLERFLTAQAPAYADVLDELRAGSKRSHWMWFIFPQASGLGLSLLADHYAISSSGEAHAYLEHPVLGQRLRECTELTLAHAGKPIERIFDYPDHLKFRSSMTLFKEMGGGELFRRALEVFYKGRPDGRTLRILKGWNSPAGHQLGGS